VKIEFIPTTGSTVTLGDDSTRHYVDAFVAAPSEKIQTSLGIRAANATGFARSNAQWNVTFRVFNFYLTTAASVAAQLDFPLSFAQSGQLKITEASTGVTTIRTLALAIRESITPQNFVGCSFWFSFRFECFGRFTTQVLTGHSMLFTRLPMLGEDGAAHDVTLVTGADGSQVIEIGDGTEA